MYRIGGERGRCGRCGRRGCWDDGSQDLLQRVDRQGVQCAQGNGRLVWEQSRGTLKDALHALVLETAAE